MVISAIQEKNPKIVRGVFRDSCESGLLSSSHGTTDGSMENVTFGRHPKGMGT